MKTTANLSGLINKIGHENYYYKGNNFENYLELEKEANSHFKSITKDIEEEEDYCAHFELKIGECHLKEVREEMYSDDEFNMDFTIHFVESYIDPGVPAEDYFYGFHISN